MDSVLELFRQFGMEENEANVYICLCKSGTSTPVIISRQTKINRTSVYRSLEKLIAKGLVSELETVGGKRFTAIASENLNVLVEEERERVKKLEVISTMAVAELKKVQNERTVPVEVKYYNGIDGLKQVLWNTLKADPKLHIVGFGAELLQYHLNDEFAEQWRKELCLRRITSFELTNVVEDGGKWTNIDEYVNKYYKQRYISPSKLTVNHSTFIYDNSITYYHSLDRQLWAIELMNEELVSVQRQMFWHFWELGQDMEPFKKFVPKE